MLSEAYIKITGRIALDKRKVTEFTTLFMDNLDRILDKIDPEFTRLSMDGGKVISDLSLILKGISPEGYHEVSVKQKIEELKPE
jgi:hypothetical protein